MVCLVVHEASVVGGICDNHGVALALGKPGGIAQFYMLVLLRSNISTTETCLLLCC